MEPDSTVYNSTSWRVWHSGNYGIGAIFFLFGSILLFPYFSTIINSSAISAWLYIIGSFCFCLADFTEWTHYQPKICCQKKPFCRYSSLSTNFFTSLTGSIIYLIGSACFLPQIYKLNEGLYLFIAGSSFIMISQTWKLTRVISSGKRNGGICNQIKLDFSGFLVDTFADFGGLMYFTGSFLFFNPDPTVQIIAATIFSCGGFFFYLSFAFMIKRYFIEDKVQKESIELATTENKMQDKQTNQSIELN